MEIENVRAHLDSIKQELSEAPYRGFAQSLEACEDSKASAVNYVGRAGELLTDLKESLPSRLLDIIAVKMHADDALHKLAGLSDEARLKEAAGAITAMAESAEKARVVGAGIGSQFREALSLLAGAMRMFDEIGMSLIAAREHSMASADARNAALQAIDEYKEII